MTNDLLPADYHTFLQSIKTRVQQAQLRAVVAVNKELILLYWHIGHEIWKRQRELGWGAKVIDRLADEELQRVRAEGQRLMERGAS